MAELTKKISADDRLKFIAMMTVALEHERKVREYGLAIARLLGTDPNSSHVSDALYSVYGEAMTVAQMDDLLLRQGIGVEEVSGG